MSRRDGVCGGIIQKLPSQLAFRLDKELGLSSAEITRRL
jgi:hypothetical protein